MCQTLGLGLLLEDGHPFRLRHRAALKTLIGDIIRSGMDRKAAFTHIATWAREHINAAEGEQFRDIAERTNRPAWREFRPLSDKAR